MDIVYLLIPMAVVLVALDAFSLLWAIKAGQFDDLEGPAHQILMDEDEPQEPVPGKPAAKEKSLPSDLQ
ncbi:MAG: cbb3-type cytochrome oxidase assembly protein CcoS [Acidiferrobacterales bacterium]